MKRDSGEDEAPHIDATATAQTMAADTVSIFLILTVAAIDPNSGQQLTFFLSGFWVWRLIALIVLYIDEYSNVLEDSNTFYVANK